MHNPGKTRARGSVMGENLRKRVEKGTQHEGLGAEARIITDRCETLKENPKLLFAGEICYICPSDSLPPDFPARGGV